MSVEIFRGIARMAAGMKGVKIPAAGGHYQLEFENTRASWHKIAAVGGKA